MSGSSVGTVWTEQGYRLLWRRRLRRGQHVYEWITLPLALREVVNSHHVIVNKLEKGFFGKGGVIGKAVLFGNTDHAPATATLKSCLNPTLEIVSKLELGAKSFTELNGPTKFAIPV